MSASGPGSASTPTPAGKIIAFLEVGGLHRRYQRRAAYAPIVTTQARPFRLDLRPIHSTHRNLLAPRAQVSTGQMFYWTGAKSSGYVLQPTVNRIPKIFFEQGQVAFRRYLLDYVGRHRQGRINIWSGDFDMPGIWREQHRNR